jgi:hypothetical protein
MGATYADSVFGIHCDAIMELVETGVPLRRLESLIDDVAYLNEDHRAALWLVAWLKSRDRERFAHG